MSAGLHCEVSTLVYLSHEAVKFFLAVITHADAQLEVSGDPKPLSPLNICRGHCYDGL